MPRKPQTVAEAEAEQRARKQARYWLKVLGVDLKRHGLEHLLSPRKHGRSEYDDTPMLKSLELFVRSTARSYGISRDAALRIFVDAAWHFEQQGEFLSYEEGKFGCSAAAARARLRRKLRESGLDKKDIRELVPREWLKRGIDPEKFISFPVTKTDLREID